MLKSQDASGQIRALNEQLLTVESEKSRLSNDLTTSQMKEQQLKEQLAQAEQVKHKENSLVTLVTYESLRENSFCC